MAFALRVFLLTVIVAVGFCNHVPPRSLTVNHKNFACPISSDSLLLCNARDRCDCRLSTVNWFHHSDHCLNPHTNGKTIIRIGVFIPHKHSVYEEVLTVLAAPFNRPSLKISDARTVLVYCATDRDGDYANFEVYFEVATNEFDGVMTQKKWPEHFKEAYNNQNISFVDFDVFDNYNHVRKYVSATAKNPVHIEFTDVLWIGLYVVVPIVVVVVIIVLYKKFWHRMARFITRRG